MPTRRIYQIQVKKVLDYLSNITVATPAMIVEVTNVEMAVIRRMIHDKILTSSLNYNHNWLIPTKVIKANKDHWGFYQYRIAKYSRTIPIFHIKRTAKATLSYLVSRRPWGLSAKEAEVLLGRDCGRVLKQLVEANAIQERLYNGEKIYLHRFHKKAGLQLNHRRTNPRFKKDDEDIEGKDKVGVITYEELCREFKVVLSETDEFCDVSFDRLSAILLMFKTNKTLRTMENWIVYNSRIKQAVGMAIPIDHTTLNRAFNGVGEDFLKKVFHRLVMKLHEKGVITGRFLVVDATHIYAFCNTRKNTDINGVEGAAWGIHQGSFYGYKVHILIDSESEMPLAMIVSSGEEHDSTHFIPLMEEFDKHYDFDEIIAVLADGAYDNQSFRKIVQGLTGGIFLPACNPRKSKILKMMKQKIKKLFEKHGDKIHSVQDAFKYLGQTFLTDFNIDIGTKTESKLVEMISERLHRPFRAAVERVFSRLKAINQFEKPQSRNPSYVKKTIWWCLIGQLIQALTAHNKGLPGSMRKRTMLV